MLQNLNLSLHFSPDDDDSSHEGTTNGEFYFVWFRVTEKRNSTVRIVEIAYKSVVMFELEV